MTAEIIHNVRDARRGWIGSWLVTPLDIAKLTEADVGRMVIYRDHGHAEAGTLTSWRSGTGEVFARYSNGDTAAGASAADVVFGITRVDKHPMVPGPYPGCHHPEKCNETGRCPRDPVCFN